MSLVTGTIHPLKPLVLRTVLPLTSKTFRVSRPENIVLGTVGIRKKNNINYFYNFLVPSHLYVINNKNHVGSYSYTRTQLNINSISFSSGFKYVHSSAILSNERGAGGDPSREKKPSKMERSVKALEKALEEKTKEQQEAEEGSAVTNRVAKRPLRKRIWDEILHYYHGFRLLLIDISISSKLVWRILNGKKLTRREYKQLIRTTSDVFRLVPFSVFIIVPFMELLLPIFIKMFPNMLPSTFQSKKDKESSLKGEMKVKLEMAKFLQQTLDDMAPEAKGRSSEQAKEFAEFIEKIRAEGSEVTTEEILKFSKLFEDEVTLDSLSRQQLLALCRVLDIPAVGISTILRFQLRLKLRNLKADDKVIESEGIDKLNYQELQNACKARGMRAVGMSEDRLKRQLNQWLTLSLHEKVPATLLLLTRAMFLPDNIPASQQLQATLQALPNATTIQTKAAIGEREGKIDHKTRIELIKEEDRKIREERQEARLQAKLKLEQEAAKREMLEDQGILPLPEKKVVDPVSTVVDKPYTPDRQDFTVVGTVNATLFRDFPDELQFVEKVKVGDFDEIERVIAKIGNESKLTTEKAEITNLRSDISDYLEDVQELEAISEKARALKIKVRQSKAARHLLKKLNNMIGKLDETVASVNILEKDKKADIQKELVATEELLTALRKAKDVQDPAKLERIAAIFSKLDNSGDGKIEVDDLVKVIDVVGKEQVNLSAKQLEELVLMLAKEERRLKDEVVTTKNTSK